ncbi:MAG: sensor histidine kinase [Promethearchaeati archaeon]
MDFISALLIIIALLFLIIYQDSYFDKAENMVLAIILALLVFYHLINVLEWANINIVLSEYEDYLAIIIPLFWLFFLHLFIQKKHQKNLKEREEKLNKLYHQTELYKNLFAHDVKNIFQNIKSAIELFEIYFENSETNEEKILELIDVIETQIKRGEKLANNVYKLSQVRDKAIELKKMDLISLLETAKKNILKVYNNKNIEFIFDPPKTRIYVEANEFLLDVFENLLNNAIIHNESVPIKIKILIEEDQDSNLNFIRIVFLDNGPGISNAIKEKLFKDVITESKNGMGIGLYLVKHIIDNYDGKIWVEDNNENDFNNGTKFIIELKKF